MNFQDKWSRWHHKEMTSDRYSSNNAWAYSAECMSVGLPVDLELLRICWDKSVTEYAFKRHPDQDAPAISHDEIININYVLNLNCVSQWEKQHWQICDLPDFEPTPWHKIDLFGVIHDYYQIIKLGRLYKKTNGQEGVKMRHATALFPRVYPIAFHMGGWKRYLIKRHSGAKTTLYEKLSFLGAKLFTVYISKSSSSLRLLGFQFKMIKNKNTVEKLVEKAYNKKHSLRIHAENEYHPKHPILERL